MNNKIRNLINKLNQASNKYYNGEQSNLSDSEWDRMFDQLKEIEQSTNIIYSDSPTRFAGYEVVGKLGKVKHSTPLLSLAKTKSIDELKEWLGNKEGVLSWKLDGSTAKLQIKNGFPVNLSTRGSSRSNEGQNITHNMKSIKNIPSNFIVEDIQIIGENVVSKEDFSNLNKNKEYQNARNFGNATVSMLDSKIVASRNVQFIAFNTLEDNNIFRTKVEQLEWLKNKGFKTVPYQLVTKDNLEEKINEFINNRDNFEYEVDGLVLAYNNLEHGRSLGKTEHHFKDAIAFKFDDEKVETVLRDIEVNVGKSGQISYVAIFDEVELEGTDVSRASLHNYGLIKDLEIGIEDTILVQKSNAIIPQVVGNITRSNTYTRDYICPSCGNILSKKINTNGEDSVNDFCPNTFNCPKKIIGELSHFASRDATNIEGLNEKTIESIRVIKKENGNSVLNSVSDIYDIPKYKNNLIKLEGFGKKKVDNLCEAIEKSKTMPLSNVLYGLSIPQIGHKASKLIAELYPNINEIFEFDKYELSLAIGNSASDSFVQNFTKIKSDLIALKSYGLTLIQSIEEKSNILDNKTFVITGSINHFKNRKDLQAKIEILGGKVGSSVTSNTSFLINNDNTSNTSKNKSAKELGVKIITEEEFLEMINKNK